MAGLYSPDPLPDSITLQEMGTQALAPSVGEVQGAVAGAALAGLPTYRLGEQAALAIGETGGVAPDVPFVPSDLAQPLAPQPTSRLLSPDEANQKYAVEGHLKFDAPIFEDRASLLHDQKLDAAKRADILNRNEGTQWGTGLVARFLPSLAISALDPLNVAAAFVPVIGEARYAELLAAQGTSAFARAGVRAGVGAAQGAVGTAALQPLEFALSRAEQNDYTATDALKNIAVGSILGGGLHTLGGYIGDVRDARLSNPLAQRLEDAGPEARDTLLRGAVAQTAEERPVNVAAALDAHELAAGEAEAARAARQAEYEAPSEAAPAVPVEGVPPPVFEAPVPIPEVAQAQVPTPDVSQQTIDAAAFRQEIAAAGGQMNVASDQLANRVGLALDEGRPVTLVTSDGKPVPIVAVTRGMMQDAAGNRWGTMDLATDNTGRARVEIGSPGDVLREAPTSTPNEIRQQLLDIQRAEPAPRDPPIEAEAQRVAEKVPVNTDEAAATKMLADAQSEIEALRQPAPEGVAEAPQGAAPRGELPPEVQKRLDESDAESAREEDHARALEEAGACLSEQGIPL